LFLGIRIALHLVWKRLLSHPKLRREIFFTLGYDWLFRSSTLAIFLSWRICARSLFSPSGQKEADPGIDLRPWSRRQTNRRTSMDQCSAIIYTRRHVSRCMLYPLLRDKEMVSTRRYFIALLVHTDVFSSRSGKWDRDVPAISSAWHLRENISRYRPVTGNVQ